MKTMIRMEVKDFQKALKSLGAVVPTKSALPILQSVMLSYDEQGSTFMLQASDSENWLQIDCIGAEKDGERQPWAILIENDRKDPFRSVAVRYDKLSQAILALPVTLTIFVWVESKGDQLQLRVDYQTGEFCLPCEPDDDTFPTAPAIALPEQPSTGTNVSPVCSLKVDAKWLMPRMQSARAATLTGSGAELRPVMSCECLDVDQEGVTIAASDGHQLYRDRLELGLGSGFLQMFARDENGSVLMRTQLLVPHKAVQIAVKTFAPQGDIAIVADTQKLSMAVEGVRMTSTTLDSKFPNYNSVIPKEQPHSLVVDAKHLQTVLQRIKLFTDEASELIRMERQDQHLVISGEDVANAFSAEERVEIQNAEDTTLPDGFAIGVKQSTLREMISCIETDNLVMKFRDPQSPITIYEEDRQSQLVILVMPMLINSKGN